MAFQVFKIVLHKKADKYLNKLPKKIKEQIEEALTTISINPYLHSNIKMMRGIGANIYRYRHGDYRIVYEIQKEVLLVYVLTIGPRGDVYK